MATAMVIMVPIITNLALLRRTLTTLVSSPVILVDMDMVVVAVVVAVVVVVTTALPGQGYSKPSPDAVLLSSLQRGQKRDINAFPELNSEVEWHEFQLKTKTIGRSQGVGRVFDPTYQPRSHTENEAFQIM